MANSVTEVPLFGERVNITGNKLRADFLTVLQHGIENSGARLVNEAAPGVIMLSVTGLDEDKTVSAYSSVRQVREFNHYIDLSFTARKPLVQGDKVTPTTSKVRAERTQIYDSRYVLGVSEEELNIRSELRSEVVRLLALKLSVL